MKSLKSILEASILADIDDQLESGDEALKSVIIKWLKDNVKSIQDNKLKFNLNTSPITVDCDGDIEYKTNIASLTNGMFQWGKVGGTFSCSFCKSLKSLEGAPKEVGGTFSCSFCKSLKSLEGAPKEVGGDFKCYNCYLLESLEGAPENVGNSFNCSFCKSLKSLKGASKEVGEDFYCFNCGAQFTEEDIKKVCKVKGEISC